MDYPKTSQVFRTPWDILGKLVALLDMHSTTGVIGLPTTQETPPQQPLPVDYNVFVMGPDKTADPYLTTDNQQRHSKNGNRHWLSCYTS